MQRNQNLTIPFSLDATFMLFCLNVLVVPDTTLKVYNFLEELMELTRSCCTHGYILLWAKDADKNCKGKSRAQEISECGAPLPVELRQFYPLSINV